MAVVPIRKATETAPPKSVEATQKAVDALPFNSGTWRVDGILGLYVRCRASSKSFFVQRRVERELVRQYLGKLAMKAAKEAAAKRWAALRPKPAVDGIVSLGTAIDQYIESKNLAEKTRDIARYNVDRYLVRWKDRSLEDIGKDREGVRLLQQHITRKHGPSTSNQVVRLIAAVYRWHRKVKIDLPESPTAVAEIHKIPARDWAYSDSELKAWWHAAIKAEDDKTIHKGVSTLGIIKRMWWLTALLTGARKGSIEALKWSDLDLDKKLIRFRVTKGNRPYSVPISNTLAELLARYQKSADVPPSEWVFPSPVIDGAHLVDVKNPGEGVGPAHRLRHTFRTRLADLGATGDQARLLMGHSMGGDVSRDYISQPLVVESLRPIANAIAELYLKLMPKILE